MKKAVSILLLFIYVNAAFAVGFDFHYCGNKLISVQVFAISKEACKDTPFAMKMKCCKDETSFCQTDNSKIRLTTTILPIPSNEYDNTRLNISKDEVVQSIPVKEFKNHFFRPGKSSREILSFIHVLRI